MQNYDYRKDSDLIDYLFFNHKIDGDRESIIKMLNDFYLSGLKIEQIVTKSQLAILRDLKLNKILD